LLVLDTCDRVRDEVAALVRELLVSWPSLAVLATSRAPLGLTGEQVWRVEPLPVPAPNASLERIASNEAVRLLVDRIAAQLPAFSLTRENAESVTTLCRQLDGMPLALELAASRVPALGLQEVMERARTAGALDLQSLERGRAPRHASLSGNEAWTFDVLGARERALLERVSVFGGWWTFNAAEQICADDELPRAVILNGLHGLVYESVVLTEPRPAEMRYRLLHTTRAFASQRIALAEQQDPLRQRFFGWYAALAAEGQPGPPDRASVGRLEQEVENFRVALAWAAATGQLEHGLRMWFGCGQLWLEGGYQHEGLGWLRQLGEVRRQVTDPQLQVRVARLAGSLHDAVGDRNEAIVELRNAFAGADSSGDDLASADARSALAEVLMHRGDPSAAREWFEAALSRQPPAASWLGGAIHAGLAQVHAELGNRDAAHRHAAAAMREAEQSAAPWTLARAWYASGLLASSYSEPRTAIPALTKAISYAQLASTDLLVSVSIDLALISLDLHRQAAAARLLAQALEQIRQRPQWRSCARALDAAAELIASSQALIAARVVGATASLRASRGGLAPARDRERLAHWMPRTRSRAGQRWNAAFAEGQGWTAATAMDIAERELQTLVKRFEGQEHLLNARERQIARLLAEGLTNRAIAANLSLSEGTVRVHVDHVLRKLQLRSRVQVRDWLASENERVEGAG
jgi:non-specific serine/threonine protein kinase